MSYALPPPNNQRFLKYFWLVLLIVAVLHMTGCSAYQQALMATGLATVKEYDDAKTKLAIEAPCVAPIGGLNRAVKTGLITADQRKAIDTICDGSSPVDMDDLRLMVEIMKQIENTKGTTNGE